MKITLDFETRSELDVRKVGAWRYSEHPSTDVLCLCFAIDGEPVQTITREMIDMYGAGAFQSIVHEILAKDEDQIIFEAHNAGFERAIWQNVLVKKYGCPEIPLTQWRCSASAAAALALPRALEDVGRVLSLDVVKDKLGKRAMQKLSKPRKQTKNNSETFWTPATAPNDFQTLYNYCATDVNTERALSRKIGGLSPSELAIWQLDQRINQHGIELDVATVKSAVKIRAAHTADLEKEVQTISGGILHNTGSRQQVLAYFNTAGHPLSAFTKSYIKEILAAGYLPRELARLLEIRQELGKSSVAKLDKMLSVACGDNRIRDLLLYHGASTGRWAGRLVQFQNLPRGSIKDTWAAADVINTGEVDLVKFLYGNPMEAISSCLRSFIVAGEGKKFVVADFAAIEARVLAWLAGQDDLVRAFNRGDDIYRTMASVIFNKPEGEITKDERFVGKQTILGSGYQMGPPKFVATCKLLGQEVTLELGTKAINTYRRKYSKIRSLWYDTQALAINAVLAEQEDDVEKYDDNPYFMDGDFLKYKLPSGRCISYYKPEVEKSQWADGGDKYELSYMGVNSKTKKWCRIRTYGGMLVENIVQGIARDLMAEAMQRLEARGFTMVLSVHDEAVCETPDTPDYTPELMVEIMTQVPKWATGCPIAAEAWEGKRYKK